MLAGVGISTSCSGSVQPEETVFDRQAPCEAAERRCVGNQLEECNAEESAFGLLELCAAGSCNPVTLECNACLSGTTDCADESSVRTCGSDGQWQEASPCPDDQTCLLDACGGDCREGDQRCVPGVDHYEVCGSDGTWGPPVDCGTGSVNSWDVCREGLCVDSPEYAVGDDDVAGWDTIAWDADTLVLMPLVVESDARLFALEVITATGGGFVKMVLWHDNNGYPDQLIVSTTNAAVLTGAERVTRFATPTLPELAAGRTYWLGAVFSADVTLYTQATGGPNTLVHPYAFAGNFVDLDPFPDTATTGDPLDLGISLQVKDVL